MDEPRSGRVSYQDGARAVELAREAVESFVRHDRREHTGSMRDAFYARSGALVRLRSTRGRGRLRGCAGAYRGADQLGRTIVEAAIAAASENSCGTALDPAECSNLSVSVCLVADHTITDDPLADLDLGTHGVAVDAGDDHAWLYPTLPVENDWSEAEFLARASRKATGDSTAWRDDALVTLFDGQVFRERPDGSVEAL